MAQISKELERLLSFAIQFQKELYLDLETYKGLGMPDYAIIPIIEEFNKWRTGLSHFLLEYKDEINYVAFAPILLRHGVPSKRGLKSIGTDERYKSIFSSESRELLQKMKEFLEEVVHIFSKQDLNRIRQKVVISKRSGVYLGNSKKFYRPKPGSKVEKLLYSLRDGGKRVRDLKELLDQDDRTVRKAKSNINERCREKSLLSEDLIIYEDPFYTLNPVFNYEWKD